MPRSKKPPTPRERGDHILARMDHVLCTLCHQIEPIHAGHGTPLSTLIFAYRLLIGRHLKCKAPKTRKASR